MNGWTLKLKRRTDIQPRGERLPGHYHDSRIITWGGRVLANGQAKPYRYALHAGNDDWLEFWEWSEGQSEGPWLYVLSRHHGLGYIGIDVIEGHTPYPTADPNGFIEPPVSWFSNDPSTLKQGTPLLDMRGDNVIRWANDNGLI